MTTAPEGSAQHRIACDFPDSNDVSDYLAATRNWGRWGPDDARGTINLVTPAHVVAAARLIRTGQTVSLSRPFPTEPGPGNPQPAVEYWSRSDWRLGTRPGGVAADYLAVSSHGVNTTHLDALCHVWDENGMYNGRDPEQEITFGGATFGGIEEWRTGIVTRSVLLDVPRHRGTAFVDLDTPVHGPELEAILQAQKVELHAGDSVCIYSGREQWQATYPERPYGIWADADGVKTKPGLHASCLKFLREHDVSVLVWDMMDEWPQGYDVAFTVHGAIFAHGLALLDNALLEPLADACRDEQRYEFALCIAPLVLPGGTASPVNPIAVF